MSMKKIVAKRISALADKIQADADYVYDPSHQNRPHGGGNWHKTDKGWSTKEENESSRDEESQKLERKWLNDYRPNIHHEVEDIQKSEDPEFLHKMSEYDNPMIRKYVAENQYASSETLDNLSKDGYSEVRCEVARNSNTSEETLRVLAGDKDTRGVGSVVSWVAQNPHTPQDVLVKLGKSRSYSIRQNVAGNSNTSEKILRDLSNDKEDIVRAHVASNINVPKDVLEKLASDKDYFVRQSVAGNPGASKELLEKFMNDDNSLVRLGIVYNPNAPDDIMNKLMNDKSSLVSEKAKREWERRKEEHD